jgi:hypothetical protein
MPKKVWADPGVIIVHISADIPTFARFFKSVCARDEEEHFVNTIHHHASVSCCCAVCSSPPPVSWALLGDNTAESSISSRALKSKHWHPFNDTNPETKGPKAMTQQIKLETVVLTLKQPTF